MPKQVDPEYDPMIREELPTSVPENDAGKQLTQRELGRLKNKKALLAKIQQKQGTPQTSEADKIDRGERDPSLVEEFDNLRTSVSPQNATLPEDHEPYHEQWTTGCPGPVGRGRRLEEAVEGEGRSLDRREA